MSAPVFDLHRNFGISLIAVAPIPAASGTTFNVTAGDGATLFPVVPFNVVVWPAGANPTATNAEVLRVTAKGTGDNWTATRTQESSVARAIALGDQVALAMTAKMFTDIESAVTSVEARVTTNESSLVVDSKARTPGGRLTVTTGLAVTSADVTGASASTLYYTPHVSNVLSLYSGTAWADFTFAEISIVVPAVANQMYDVFVFSNAGTPTLEVLAWTNDSTRATALVKQDGHWVKTGATTRLYVGSFRTTTVAGQTEDSMAKRLVWNYFNRVRRAMRVLEATASWSYTTATLRQANGAAGNQLAFVIGVAEVTVETHVAASFINSTGLATAVVSIGADGVGSVVTGTVMAPASSNSTAQIVPVSAAVRHIPAAGYHFNVWMEYSTAVGTTSWQGVLGAPFIQSGIFGSVEG